MRQPTTPPTTEPVTPPDAAAAGLGAEPSAASDAPPIAPAKRRVPRKVVCPVSGTVFNPRATGGRCPVCGEQVVPAAEVGGAVPLAGSASQWLGQGGWRLVALIMFILYQLGIFAALWIHLAAIHAF